MLTMFKEIKMSLKLEHSKHTLAYLKRKQIYVLEMRNPIIEIKNSMNPSE